MQVTTIGLDLAKKVFQVHGVVAEGGIVVRKKLCRVDVLTYFSTLPPCLIGMEASALAHHRARVLTGLGGHEVKLMPPSYVKPYVKRDKNDAAGAEAICEAVTRPSMRFVPAKSAEQQSAVMLHRSRDLLIRRRTMLANALRGQVAELGIVAAQGLPKLPTLIEVLLEETDRRIPLWLGGSLACSSPNCRTCRLRSRLWSVRSSRGIGRAGRASGWRRSPGSASSPRPPLRRR